MGRKEKESEIEKLARSNTPKDKGLSRAFVKDDMTSPVETKEGGRGAESLKTSVG